jgi:hypothetical protein
MRIAEAVVQRGDGPHNEILHVDGGVDLLTPASSGRLAG